MGRVIGTMLLGWLAFAPGMALAESMSVDSRAEAPKVSVEVVVVRASREGRVDPRLQAMKKEMASRGFGGFSLAGAERRAIDEGSRARFELSGSYTAEVRLLRRTPSNATLRVSVHKQGVLQHKADVTMPRNEGFITVVSAEGRRPALVVAITPRF